MYVKYLQLKDYRNYELLSIDLVKGVNVFKGDNAQGKTNVLESIYYCGFGKSHRTSKDKELIRWDKENSIINLHVSRERLDKKININILKNGKKAITINSIKINKISELIGTFNVVMFSPEDLRVVKESPGVRRKFIDMEISQLNPKYYHSLVQYNKVLNERNIILKKRTSDSAMIDIYDEQLSSFGEYIIKKRLEYLNKLNIHGKDIHRDITSNKEDIEFRYITSVDLSKDIKENLKSNLAANRKKDIDKGNTSVGPHRDDLGIYLNQIDAKSFGSQGQQRTAVLTMKFASLKIIKELTGEYPVLLLDDVLSELDINRKKYILSSIDDIQTIITCTGIEDINENLQGNYKVFNVEEGHIEV
ncbi:DNA replication/repair protein RecF [Clostridium sp.]|uniref:DNA replication/repair protein RecF n=1 Tax=Clostridium sp. TaxID=1506 RepID=UPI003463B729